MKLSVVIPAYNEAASLEPLLNSLYSTLSQAKIEHEILVVNDHSKDKTAVTLSTLKRRIPTLASTANPYSRGFGTAVRAGLERFTGDCAAIFMADRSDSPEDLVLFYRKLSEGYDCVFGSRFMKGGGVKGYPWPKWVLNRLANHFTRFLFGFKYNDVTNAFKLYRRQTLEGLKPYLSPHFNLTLELPLKAIVRGYSYAVVPNHWTNRKRGVAKLKIREMGSRYFFILLYCLIEKYFSKGDYKKH